MCNFFRNVIEDKTLKKFMGACGGSVVASVIYLALKQPDPSDIIEISLDLFLKASVALAGGVGGWVIAKEIEDITRPQL